MQRRQLIQAMAVIAGPAIAPALLAQTLPQVEVWKDPDCGCCKDWVAHLEANGFAVRVHDSGNTAARKRLGIPDKLGSCHTAEVSEKGRRYALEGHVPAREVHRLLKEAPKAIGLAVPGMPVGSPGMDAPLYGGRKDPYDVLLVLQDGSNRVYQSYHRV
ncbi:DUF411 domain-containing protein [Polaromonas sp. LjRoot131]|uniref:DUF411 domain-containing protein n=1 Tax=Polaromonas sp. LjRoot131 TaxID=3342262 RepID=UPI003F4F6CE9